MTIKRKAFLLAFIGSLCAWCNAEVRVVVTEIDKDGRSVIISDGAPQLMMKNAPGSYLGDLWKIDRLPENVNAGNPPREYELEPTAAGGVKFRVASIPPTKKIDINTEQNDEFGMHRTNTIDFITIISGEMSVLLDSGEKTLLKAGDTLIQRGTNHAWINQGEVPCVFSAVMIRPTDVVEHAPDADH